MLFRSPVRIIVPFPAGGPSDYAARVVSQRLPEFIGQPVVVDNRPGAAGDIGADIVAHAVPDGYTLLAITATHTVSAALRPKIAYDLLRDLTPLSQVTSLPYMLVVHPALPAKTVRELIALAKTRNGEIGRAHV